MALPHECSANAESELVRRLDVNPRVREEEKAYKFDIALRLKPASEAYTGTPLLGLLTSISTLKVASLAHLRDDHQTRSWS